MFFALLRHNPMELMVASTAPSGAFARAAASGYFANSSLVTRLTARSVVWAESTVATRSWKGLAWRRAQRDFGYASARARSMARARCARSALLSRGGTLHPVLV